MPSKINKFAFVKHGSYNALLFDPRWKDKRKEILKRDNYCCIVCKSKENVQVHHRQYHFIRKHKSFKKPWEYSNSLLISLCKKCHQKGHQLYDVPTKYI